jgi:hypothetical protein
VSRLLHACSEQPQQTLNMPLPFTYNHCTCTHTKRLLVLRFAVPAHVGPLPGQALYDVRTHSTSWSHVLQFQQMLGP